jgi:hypothetical protein
MSWLIFSGDVYHIYIDPDLSAGPVSTDTFKYDPDSMFEQYQASANAGGMFRRFPFQRAFHGTCIIAYLKDDLFTLFIMAHKSASCYPDTMFTSKCLVNGHRFCECSTSA